jgi:hypothetical protein
MLVAIVVGVTALVFAGFLIALLLVAARRP